MSGSEDVLLLTGPPGSGKTTVATLFAARFDRAVHLEADLFFHAIVQGYIEPWKPESHEQNEAVMSAVGDAAATFTEAGYLTIVDGILVPGWFYEPIRDALRARGLQVSAAFLRPSLDVCLARVAARPMQVRPVDVAAIEQLWNSFSRLGPAEGFVIENGSLDAIGTTSVLADRYGEGALRV